MGIRVTWILAVMVLFFAVSRPANAQTDRANLEGTITDSTGAVVSGAKVQITNTATGISQERESSGHGYYLFPGLAVGAIPFRFRRSDLTRRSSTA